MSFKSEKSSVSKKVLCLKVSYWPLINYVIMCSVQHADQHYCQSNAVIENESPSSDQSDLRIQKHCGMKMGYNSKCIIIFIGII